MNPHPSAGVPLVGAPKLSDAPPLPDQMIPPYLQGINQALAQGASFAQPVQVELLVLGTALRDLQALRQAVRGLDPLHSVEIRRLLPENQPGGPNNGQ